jgi:hypothetical protein
MKYLVLLLTIFLIVACDDSHVVRSKDIEDQIKKSQSSITECNSKCKKKFNTECDFIGVTGTFFCK